MREYLNQRIQELIQRREQLMADLNATLGALETCDEMLVKLNEMDELNKQDVEDGPEEMPEVENYLKGEIKPEITD